MAGTPARKPPRALPASKLPKRPKPGSLLGGVQAEVPTEVKTVAKSSSTTVRGEVSVLRGGPRDGRAYYTDDLTDVAPEYHPHSEGYAKTQGFVDHTWQNGPKYPAGDPQGRGGQLVIQRARIWRWVGVNRDGR